MRQGRVLLGISLFWLALSLVFDGINALVLPRHLLGLVDQGSKAAILGLVSCVGPVAGMLVQPMAGAFSDRLRPRWGWRGTLALGALALLISLALFGLSTSLLVLLLSYLLVQVAASTAQAARRLGITRQAVQRVVNDLQADGLVCFDPNPRHARSPLVRLTEPGREALDQITRAATGWQRLAAQGLSLTDLLTTRSVLRHLIAATTPAAEKPPRRR